jgi:hypothetical protein
MMKIITSLALASVVVVAGDLVACYKVALCPLFSALCSVFSALCSLFSAR